MSIRPRRGERNQAPGRYIRMTGRFVGTRIPGRRKRQAQRIQARDIRGSDGEHRRERADPRKWAVGRLFEHVLSLPGPTNAGGRPPSRGKPSGKKKANCSASKPRAKAAPKNQQPKERPALSSTEVEAKREEPCEYDRQRNKTPERREQNRLNAQEKRRRAKEQGLCRHCPNPAIPNQTRCPSCAEKHRVSRRKWQARRKEEQESVVTTEALPLGPGLLDDST